jgi:hypothetical protein
MALGVVVQLALGLVMSPPDAVTGNTGAGRVLFEVHEACGMALLIPVCFQWVRLLSRPGRAGLARLFPLAAGARKRVRVEWRRLARGRLPASGPRVGLAGLVHGLGLLNLTAMLLSGSLLFLTLEVGSGVHSTTFDGLAGIHSLFAGLMWLYLAGHVGAALLHVGGGDHVMAAMFRP